MRLSDIEQAGRIGAGTDTDCVCCGKKVSLTPSTLWVHIDYVTGEILPYFAPPREESGCEPIGSDCYKRHKAKLAGFIITAADVLDQQQVSD
jgi:hypothetical protein